MTREIWFKDISYLELWRPFCSAERNHLKSRDKTLEKVGIISVRSKDCRAFPSTKFITNELFEIKKIHTK